MYERVPARYEDAQARSASITIRNHVKPGQLRPASLTAVPIVRPTLRGPSGLSRRLTRARASWPEHSQQGPREHRSPPGS